VRTVAREPDYRGLRDRFRHL